MGVFLPWDTYICNYCYFYAEIWKNFLFGVQISSYEHRFGKFKLLFFQLWVWHLNKTFCFLTHQFPPLYNEDNSIYLLRIVSRIQTNVPQVSSIPVGTQWSLRTQWPRQPPSHLNYSIPALRSFSYPSLTLGIISFWNICKLYKWKWIPIIIFMWLYLIISHRFFFSYLLSIFVFLKHLVSIRTNHIICRT